MASALVTDAVVFIFSAGIKGSVSGVVVFVLSAGIKGSVTGVVVFVLVAGVKDHAKDSPLVAGAAPNKLTKLSSYQTCVALDCVYIINNTAFPSVLYTFYVSLFFKD